MSKHDKKVKKGSFEAFLAERGIVEGFSDPKQLKKLKREYEEITERQQKLSEANKQIDKLKRELAKQELKRDKQIAKIASISSK